MFKSSISKMQSPDLSHSTAQQPLVVIVGPTAAGKTEISIQVAERLGAEIVSADSRLFYRGMDIGTAKPSLEERRRVPHHLIDVAEPDEIWSLARFQAAAHQVIREIHQRNRLPLLVGGTGQYIRAVTQGWLPPEVAPNPALRKVLEELAQELGAEGLHRRLAVVDPVSAEKIDPRNLRRTIRAFEVMYSTGRRFSEQRRQGVSPYKLLILGVNRSRQELYERIDRRVDEMLRIGLVEEVQRLLDRGYPPELPTLSAIGYVEIIAYLQARLSLEEAVLQIKRNTRVFVRRQANWFKPADPEIQWFMAGADTNSQMIACILKFFNIDI